MHNSYNNHYPPLPNDIGVNDGSMRFWQENALLEEIARMDTEIVLDFHSPKEKASIEKQAQRFVNSIESQNGEFQKLRNFHQAGFVNVDDEEWFSFSFIQENGWRKRILISEIDEVRLINSITKNRVLAFNYFSPIINEQIIYIRDQFEIFWRIQQLIDSSAT